MQAGNPSLRQLAERGAKKTLPLLLFAREGGRGDEYMKIRSNFQLFFILS
jgi:hypothetical protein